MKIARRVVPISPQFYDDVHHAMRMLERRLKDTDFYTWKIRRYVKGIRIILSQNMVSSGGRVFPSKRLIALNARLLRRHPEELLGTLTHEVAHLLAYKLYGLGGGHGREWQQLMVALGCEPNRYHRMDVEGLLRAERSRLLDSSGRKFMQLCLKSLKGGAAV